ncbi:ciliary microtubule inner protein 2A [Porphyrio hochstetteri]
MAAQKGNSFFPPNPCHVPGYQGFIPQYNYRFGETFGKTTHRLLTDPEVGRSPRPVLAPLRRHKFIKDFSGTNRDAQGYLPRRAGYIPYEMVGAATSFPDPALEPKPPEPGSVEEELMMDPVPQHHPGEYVPRIQPSRREMIEDLEHLPWYSGFVPCLTWINGVNYTQAVKEAMNEFDRRQFMEQNPAWGAGRKYPPTYWPDSRIYTSAGQIPAYMGFVPELRHTYALTFGNSTRKAYQKEQRRRAGAL